MNRSRHIPVACALTLVLAVALAGLARAGTCPGIAGGSPGLEAHEAEARLALVSELLEREGRRVGIWRLSWGIVFTTSSVAGLTGLALLEDRGRGKDLGVTGVKAGIGALSLWVLPVRVERPGGGPAAGGDREICADLAAAERALIAAAASERRGRGWINRGGGLALNLAGVAYLGFGEGRWSSAILSGLLGLVVGELKVWTQPTGAIDGLARYRAGDLHLGPGRSLQLGPLVAPGAVGLELAGDF